MGKDLATDIATDSATDLATDLAPGGWRNSVTGLVEYWRWGYGETLIGGNLDSWTGQVSGDLLTAPSAPQRPTPGAKGWTFVPANSTVVYGAASAVLSAVSGAAAHTAIVTISPGASVDDCPWMFCDPSSDSVQTNLYQSSGTSWVYRRRSGTIQALNFTGPSSGLAVVAVTYDGTNGRVYLDGSLVAGPTAQSHAPAVTRVSLGAAEDLNPGSYWTGDVHDFMVCDSALDAAEISTISTQLLAEYA